ncbi:hypothetical protein MKW92_028259 [Papaver armeniacum]|nr:hypothetical protein MKW92_028259 [Papaver armeniacum]
MACTIDFRRLDEGLGGTRNKRKRSHEEELEFTFTNTSMDVDDEVEPSAKRTAISSPSITMNIKVNPRTFDERMKEKDIKKEFKSRVDELKLEIKNNKIDKRLKREEREKKKQENILRTWY